MKPTYTCVYIGLAIAAPIYYRIGRREGFNLLHRKSSVTIYRPKSYLKVICLYNYNKVIIAYIEQGSLQLGNVICYTPTRFKECQWSIIHRVAIFANIVTFNTRDNGH